MVRGAGLLQVQEKQKAFTENGFNNRKKTNKKFEQHPNSGIHRSAMGQVKLQKQPGIIAQLDVQTAQEQQKNWQMVLKQLSGIRMLLRQGLTLRSHDELDGSLLQLLQLSAEDYPLLEQWVKNRKYLSSNIVNEQINLMGQASLRQLLVGIHSVMWYAVMADETRYIYNEQVTVCIRWVDKSYEVHEDFIGLVNVPNAMAETITSILKDVLIWCNLPLSMCHGQAYDGAANMSRLISGVATKILQEEPAALHVHCLAHCLNLCLQDVARQFQPIRDVLDLCIESGKLILLSPKRMQLFNQSINQSSIKLL